MKTLFKTLLGALMVVIVGLLCLTQVGFADPSSTNYRFTETSLGGLGGLGGQSANFQSAESGAVLGIGNSASTNLQINSGHLTTNDPALTFIINNGSVNFGTFSATTATTTTSTFSVINYTSYGYVVQILGSAPTNGAHTISTMATTGPSQAGVEQFGINMVANTSPVSFGANPDHGSFGFGSAATNYNTSNQFRFVNGETIASAPQSSGQTTYTISYLVNVSSITPGGQYSGNQTLICTGTY